MTRHSVFIGPSQRMTSTGSDTVDLVVTSPPYPMIEMWDEIMGKQNPDIINNLENNPGKAFELMHKELDKVWAECYRVLKNGGFLCVNVGDATRTINGNFTLYNNHSRISKACLELGFTGLPNIIWRKQTNAPNKFMGSGMLPCGAYVTLEHEWILIFRKGRKRQYKTNKDKHSRMKSSFFWEERNVWFSDMWDIKGTKQNLINTTTRERSAAFPFEIPYRLINMFSQKGDYVLDPFLGTGTTIQSSILLGRNSSGYEIDTQFEAIIRNGIESMDINACNMLIKKRVDSHKAFISERKKQNKEIKHFNSTLGYDVMTGQEEEIEFNYIQYIRKDQQTGNYIVGYEEQSDMNILPQKEGIFADIYKLRR